MVILDELYDKKKIIVKKKLKKKIVDYTGLNHRKYVPMFEWSRVRLTSGAIEALVAQR